MSSYSRRTKTARLSGTLPTSTPSAPPPMQSLSKFSGERKRLGTMPEANSKPSATVSTTAKARIHSLIKQARNSATPWKKCSSSIRRATRMRRSSAMLFNYRYVGHSIERFQVYLDHLVKEVWCKATDDFSVDLLHPELREIVLEIYNTEVEK